MSGNMNIYLLTVRDRTVTRRRRCDVDVLVPSEWRARWRIGRVCRRHQHGVIADVIRRRRWRRRWRHRLDAVPWHFHCVQLWRVTTRFHIPKQLVFK